MRGADSYNEALFTTVKLEDFVPANHPLRPIRTWVNGALVKMDAKFTTMYEADIKGGRPNCASPRWPRTRCWPQIARPRRPEHAAATHA